MGLEDEAKMRRGFFMVLAVILLASAGLGCTKRVPLEEPVFDGRRKVVLTFKDGSELSGRIGLDERIDVVTGGRAYRGVVAELTDEEIILDDCRFVREVGKYTAEQQRMADARVKLDVESASFVFVREDIERVEQVKTDALRTTTQAVFWTFTAFVSIFLMQDNS